MSLPSSQALFLLLIGAVAIERLVELAITRRNAARIFARGGIERGQGHYPWMVLLHTSFLVAAPLEVYLLERPFVGALGWPMVALAMAAMALRYWAIQSLAGRWATRVMLVPGETALRRGPYRWLRHPNYVAVVVELFALPLIHGAWCTALLFSLANVWLLRTRIRVEEATLIEHASYEHVFERTTHAPGDEA